MDSRDFQSAVFIKMDASMAELREVKKYAKAIDAPVKAILPQTHLQPFSKPPQKSVGRDLNVAHWFREKTMSENAMLPSGSSRKYLEFPVHVSDEQLNDDMERCMHGILCERLKPGWETMNWTSIYNMDKVSGEQIIREAAQRPEMAVIAQSAGYWAIRTIAEQRQKSTKRAAEQKNTRKRRKAEQNKSSTNWQEQHRNVRNSDDNDMATRKFEDIERIHTEGQGNVSRAAMEIQSANKSQESHSVHEFRMTAEAVADVPDLEEDHAEIVDHIADKNQLHMSEESESSEDCGAADVNGADDVINSEKNGTAQDEVPKQSRSDVVSILRGLSEDGVKALISKIVSADVTLRENIVDNGDGDLPGRKPTEDHEKSWSNKKISNEVAPRALILKKAKKTGQNEKRKRRNSEVRKEGKRARRS